MAQIHAAEVYQSLRLPGRGVLSERVQSEAPISAMGRYLTIAAASADIGAPGDNSPGIPPWKIAVHAPIPLRAKNDANFLRKNITIF